MPKKKGGVDYNLRFMSEVLGFDYLHWGYFTDADRPRDAFPLAELKEAQEAYTRHLFGFLPDGVRSILDVGCGSGKTAHQLQDLGYEVHCLTNDAYQQAAIAGRYPDLPLTVAEFENCPLARRFDLILMSESVQYLDWPKALAKAVELLEPGGYLLTADYFRLEDDDYYRTCKVKDDFLRLSRAASLHLVREEDITDNVLPTLDFGRHYAERYILPSANILLEMIGEKTPSLLKAVAKLCFSRRLAKIWYYIFEKTPRKLDRQLFQRKLRYLIHLWQLE